MVAADVGVNVAADAVINLPTCGSLRLIKKSIFKVADINLTPTWGMDLWVRFHRVLQVTFSPSIKAF